MTMEVPPDPAMVSMFEDWDSPPGAPGEDAAL